MNNLSEFQVALLKVFKQFAKYCEENDLTYYAAYGTLLGAVRHKGFIPWDDDIDVYMKREDYDKMIANRGFLEGTPYRITYILDGKSPYPFAKFYTTEGTNWEYKHFPFIIGPWIDIFPVDEGDINDENANKTYNSLHYLMWKYRKAIADVKWSDIWKDFIHFNGYNGPMNLVKKVYYRPFKKKYLREIAACIDDIRKIRSDVLRVYASNSGKMAFSKELFDSTLSVPFEDTQIMIPIGYDKVLTRWFGNYMQLPPIERRVSNHNCFYINLNENVPKEDILKQMAGKLNEKAQPLSMKLLINEIRHRNKGWHQ